MVNAEFVELIHKQKKEDVNAYLILSSKTENVYLLTILN